MTCNLTYEQLAAYVEGDLPAQRQAIERHVAGCLQCAARLASLRKVDAALRNLPPEKPSAATILAARRLLAEETRPKREPEILTMEEVAEFLRIPLEELAPFVSDLPAFELGGQIRVRRSRLLEWIEQREREYSRGSTASTLARMQADSFQERVA